MRLIATKKSQRDAVVDPWTAVSFGTGLATGLAEVSLGKAIGLIVAYEFASSVLTSKQVALFAPARREPAENQVVDALVYLVGWRLGTRWNRSEV
jgi:hypothetical protein